MEYVMVPVPEDLVEDVDRFIKWIATRESMPGDDEPTLLEAGAAAYGEAGPHARRLLVEVAKAAVEKVPMSLAGIAAAVGLDLHAAMGMVGEANTNFVRLGGRGAMVLPIPNPEPVPEGSPVWAHNVLAMHPDVAEMLLDL